MNLYVDDERDCPQGWELARDYTQAMRMLANNDYDNISLDHDIASYGENGEEYTGYTILCYLERERILYGRKIPFIRIHTANIAVSKKMWNIAGVLNDMGDPNA